MLTAGTRLGSYEVVAQIGAGGMGEVYQARDTKLGREVAIKVLPEAFAHDGERLARFQREAKMLASLNHPNIATIHGLEQSNGTSYLVMELVAGETLAERIKREGPLPVGEALKIAVQIADALEAAHEKGIIHRDLKPANVKVTPQGRVKVLDFGLAKAFAGEGEVDLSQAPTLTAMDSEEGRVLGTPAYMSPEQTRGKLVDKRTDIWAFGCLLYELLTGKRVFGRETTQDTIAAVLEREPDWQALPPSTPAKIQDLLRRCLQKEPQRRLRDFGDARIEIEEAILPTEGEPTRQHGPDLDDATVPTSRRRLPPARLWREGLAGDLTDVRREARWISVVVLTILLAALFGLNVGGWRERLLSRNRPSRISSLAVLPLENLSRDPQQEYFADGMTEELITELSKIGALKVISRTSVMQYKGTEKSLPQISRELGVDGIVEGSVAREGNQVRITVQLLDGPKDRHLWADSYQRELASVLALQSELAQAIASRIRIQVTPEEQGRITAVHSVNPLAHDAYLRGQSYFPQQTEAAYRKGLQSLQEAVTRDPNYALGWAGLANAYVLAGNRSFLPVSEAYREANSAAMKALGLDDTLAEAHLALASVRHFYDWDFAGAETEYKRALELSPSDAELHSEYGFFLCRMGRSEQAIAELKRAVDLDPYSATINYNLGRVLHYSRRYDEAIAQYKKWLELFPQAYPPRYQLARLYIANRRYEDAVAEIKQLEENYGSTDMLRSLSGVAYAFAGKKNEAIEILDQLKEKQRREFVRPYFIAEIYIGLGEKQLALDWLEKAYEQRDDWVVWFKCDPIPDGLRSEPRFQELMRRIGFPP